MKDNTVNRPLVSVIIPFHNTEKYLKKTILSVKNQTYKNWEIILIDDGSTDSSFSIAQEYQSEKIKLYRQNNKGASSARNLGFKYSSGKYIQYLDADDILDPKKIESQVLLLETTPMDIISSCPWGRFRDDHSKAIFKNEKIWTDYEPVDWLIDSWEGGGMMQTSCWLVPKKIIEKSGGWDETLSLNDDGEFFCRVLLKSSKILYCNDAIVYYRSDIKESLSKQRSKQAILSAFRVCKLYEKNTLQIRDNSKVRHALMKNYLNFIYEYYPANEVFIIEAKEKIQNLGFKKLEPVGGKKFKLLCKVIGFNQALKIKKIL